MVVEFEAVHTCFFESKEENFKIQRAASTHTIAVVSMGVGKTHVLQGKSPPEILHLLSKLF